MCFGSACGMSLFPLNRGMRTNAIDRPLKVSHGDASPLFHRDIRWPNIIRNAHNPTKWFLINIDWEDAAWAPTQAVTYTQLDPISHCPTVFEDGHAGEVDIWAVGRLSMDMSSLIVGVSTDLENFAKRMVQCKMSAVDALAEIQNLKSECN